MTSPLVFAPVRIGSHLLANRIVRSATYEGLATRDGEVTSAYKSLYGRLSLRGPGAIVTGFAYVSDEGRSMQPHQASVADGRNVGAWQDMNRRVHDNGAKIFLQIAHAGRQTHRDATGMDVVAPSQKASPYFRAAPRPLREDEIPERAQQFVRAARIAQEAGFDGVQVHAAHGYLIHQFLTPAVNRRRDAYGVDRTTGIASQFLSEILGGIRSACGEGFDTWVKVSHGDRLRNGMDLRRFEQLVRFLQSQPIEAIEVSYGSMDHALNIFRGKTMPLDRIVAHNPRYKIATPWLAALWKRLAAPLASLPVQDFEPRYNLHAASQAKAWGKIPVISVGGFRSGQELESALRSGHCDLTALSRPFVCEPDLVRKFRDEFERDSLCTSCNQCAIMCDTPNPTLCYTRGHHGNR